MAGYSLIPFHESEARAWAWLMALRRIPWEGKSRRAIEEQVLVRLVPGDMNQSRGMPYVEVLVSYPGVFGRVKGTGNSLSGAVSDVHSKLWRKGVRLPWHTIPVNSETWDVVPMQEMGFDLALESMEQHWMESFPGYRKED